MSRRKRAADELRELLDAVNSHPQAQHDGSSAQPVSSPSENTLRHFDAPLLRQLISRPRVGVGCLLRCHELHPDAVLIGERQGSHGAGRWALPGGHMESGQSMGLCAATELSEECGLTLSPESFTFVTATNDPMPDEGLHYVTLFVTAAISAEQAGQIVNLEPHKCTGWHWLRWSEIASKPLFIPLQHFLRQGGPCILDAHVRQLQLQENQAAQEQEDGQERPVDSAWQA